MLGKRSLPQSGIRFNWYTYHQELSATLDFFAGLNRAVLEYVVAHELVHLLHRHHGDTFWETLEPFMTS
jgi:predicted metal-dependent hydrolase